MIKKTPLVVLFFPLLSIFLFSFYVIIKSRTFQFFGELYPRFITDEKIVALTFDDGPTERTDTILSILERYNVKATFFVIGKDLEKYHAEARKLVIKGHELGNHSYSHQRMVLKTSGFIKNEIEKTDSLIRNAGYKGVIYFRPPYGKKFFTLPNYLKTHNRITIMWDVEPESYQEIAIDSDKISHFILSETTKGSVILMHVMRGSDESVRSISKTIEGLQKKGYHFKTISEMIKSPTL